MRQRRLSAPLLVAALIAASPQAARAAHDDGAPPSRAAAAPPARGGLEEIIGPDDGKADDAASGETKADEAEALARAKGIKLTFRLGVRFLQTAPFSKTYQSVLSAYGYGSIFELMPSDGSYTFTDLHDFTNGSDGGYPNGDLVLDSNGNIFGTTFGGGGGVVFELTR